MKNFFSYLILLAVALTLSLNLKATEGTVQKTEMLVSLPMLSEKNAAVINNSFKSTAGIISAEVCFELNVMIISYDSKILNEEEIIHQIRSMEINSTAELLYKNDISKIKREYKTEKLN